MTLDVYAGLFGDDLDAVALALDGLVPQMCPRDPGGIKGGAVSCRRLELNCANVWWGSRGLNPGPTDYESAALTG